MNNLIQSSDKVKVCMLHCKPDLSVGFDFVRSTKCGGLNTLSCQIARGDHNVCAKSEQPDASLGETLAEASSQIFDIANGVILNPDSDSNSRVYVAIDMSIAPIGKATILICVSSTGRIISHNAVFTILRKIVESNVIWEKNIIVEAQEDCLDSYCSLLDGGDNVKVDMIDHELDPTVALEFVNFPQCSVCTFFGVVRDSDLKHGVGVSQPIEGILYEAHRMSQRQIVDILNQVINADGISNRRAYVAARTGLVFKGEASILISISSTSPSFSHQATIKVLESIKGCVAMWKKIIFSDGDEEWADWKSEAYWLKLNNTSVAHS